MIDLSRNLFIKNVHNATRVPPWDHFVFSQFPNYLGDSYWGMRCRLNHTSIVDLTQSEDELMASFKSNTRNEVRRAIREGFFFEPVDNVEEFVEFYNAFAREKHLDCISSDKITRLEGNVAMYKSGLNGATMTMHASTLDRDVKLATLLYSASVRFDDNIDRKNVGFSNRFLHYKEFVAFKEQGFEKYDFSGVCIDPEQSERFSIGLFKRSFGGEEKEIMTLQSYPIVLLFNVMRLFGKELK